MLHEAVVDLLRVNARRSWCRDSTVEAGLAQSLARPGGNLTGSTFLSLEVAGKRVELLKEALPRLRSLAALSNTAHPGEKSELQATETAATSLGISLCYGSLLAVSLWNEPGTR
jgi:ABC-type uncharacterized transport system substrate-binding protein